MFLVVELLLWLDLPSLSDALTVLGSAMLLTGFALLIINALLGWGKITVESVSDYFSAKQRAQRQLWFATAKQDQLKRLLHFKMIRITYVSELSRKHLLKRNNCQHIRSLSRFINRDLQSIKTKLTDAVYQQLQQDNIRYRNQQDIEGLLKLQQKISTLV